MKPFYRISLLITLIFSFSACIPQPTALPSTETSTGDQLAFTALTAFLDALHNGRYAEAAGLYAGSYEVLQGYNSGIDPDDYASLLQSACTINGFQCLRVKSANLEEKVSDKEYVFEIEFLNADDSLFVRGACCGGNETDSPPQSVFYCRVAKLENGEFRVVDLPPYAP
ncbi:MAG: hypothetical protein LLG42_05230 [Chloroflexi bacterium]|nr:hypothetical protein [Chloroflexota bacterium]